MAISTLFLSLIHSMCKLTSQAPHIDTTSTKPRNSPPHNHGIHIRRSTTNRTPDLKSQRSSNIQDLRIEETIEPTPDQNCRHRCPCKCRAEPRELLEAVEGTDYGSADVGYDCVVEGVEEGAAEHGADDEEPLGVVSESDGKRVGNVL